VSLDSVARIALRKCGDAAIDPRPLDETSAAALGLLRAEGLSDSEAVRVALRRRRIAGARVRR
jgi:hypothetical protein